MERITIEFMCPDDIVDIKRIVETMNQRLLGHKDYVDRNIVFNTFRGAYYGVDLEHVRSASIPFVCLNAKLMVDGIFSQLIEKKDDTDDTPSTTTTEKPETVSNPDNPIKMDGEPSTFEGGAIRYTKTGKGRFDLIPLEVVEDVLSSAINYFEFSETITTTKSDILSTAYDAIHGVIPLVDFDSVIIFMTNYLYGGSRCVTEEGEHAKQSDFSEFTQAFAKMLMDLAKHYENGAEKYGVDNWKKGIPVTGGERGGSFTDSMLRHLSQFISAPEGYMTPDGAAFISNNCKEPEITASTIVFDERARQFYKARIGSSNNVTWEKEEPHHIAVLWNAFCALWVLKNQDDKNNKPTNDELALCEGPIPQKVTMFAVNVSEHIQGILGNIGIFNSSYSHHLSKVQSFNDCPSGYSYENTLWYKLHCVNVQIQALLASADPTVLSVTTLLGKMLKYSWSIVYMAASVYPGNPPQRASLPGVPPELLKFEPKTFVESIKSALSCADDWYAFSRYNQRYTKDTIEFLKEMKELYKYNVEEFTE